jgi:hypothetical protein
VHPVQVVQVHVGDRGEHHDPGGVDHDVDPAERRLDALEGGFHLLLVGDVTADGDGLAPGRGDLDSSLTSAAGARS